MMTVSELINKANANGMHVKQSFKVLSKLDEHQQQLFLDGNCICCEGQAPAEGIWDFDYSDEGGMHGTCVGYEQELFCEGCEMHLPAEVLLDHEVISQASYDELCDPFDNYTAMDSNDLRDLHDPLIDTDEIVEHRKGLNGDDDDLPF